MSLYKVGGCCSSVGKWWGKVCWRIPSYIGVTNRHCPLLLLSMKLCICTQYCEVSTSNSLGWKKTSYFVICFLLIWCYFDLLWSFLWGGVSLQGVTCNPPRFSSTIGKFYSSFHFILPNSIGAHWYRIILSHLFVFWTYSDLVLNTAVSSNDWFSSLGYLTNACHS